MSFDGNGYAEYASTVITSKGDIIRGNASGKRERYGIGSSNQILQVSSGEPTWQTLSTAGSVLTTQGDILYHDAVGLQRLGQSTDGYVLTTKGSGANPVWAEVSTGKTFEKLGSVTHSSGSSMTWTPSSPYDQDDYEQFLIVTRGATTNSTRVYAEINSMGNNYHWYQQESNGCYVK